jgi:agmatinase
MSSEPRFTGIRTFANLPHLPLSQLAPARAPRGHGSPAQGPALAVVGVPFDTGTSWRTGARFGPEAIRSASALLRPWHPAQGVQALAPGRVVDGGDVAIVPGNAERSLARLEQELSQALAAGVRPLVLGGDHTIALGELRAYAALAGPLALVLLDAHADTWEQYYGERLFHGTFVRRAVEEGLVDPGRSLIAGLRGPLYEAADVERTQALGFELIGIDELRAGGGAEFGRRVRARVGEDPCFLGFDIDVVDPAFAPGTGTPEVGGLSSSEALELLRSLAGLRFAGFDVVEVCPPYDSPAQITALLAANVAYEMLALAALSSSAGAP